MTSHVAAGKLQGFGEDVYWYEAAFVAGVANALNVMADGLAPCEGGCLIEPAEEDAEDPRLQSTFAEIRRFLGERSVPAVFRVMGNDPGYLAEWWDAYRYIFSDKALTRKFKETLAFAISLTTRSSFGTAFHLRQMKRFGVGAKGIQEVVGVTLSFSSYTKIADTLQLKPDMENIAPIDDTPAPGGDSRQG